MIFQLTFAICIGSFFSLFFSPLSYLGTVSHQLCLSITPESAYKNLNLAIVCGKQISRESAFRELSLLGLVHIIVVSGAHLALLSNLINKLSLNKIPKLLNFTILLIFVFCCQLQTPVLRAWFYLLIKKIVIQFKLFNSTPFNILLSISLCLAFNPQSYFHISLPMSWLACLAIYKGENTFTQSTLCYLFILPVLMSFQILHPWTIVINTLITPLLCLLLFPLCLFNLLIPQLTPVTDYLWHSLFAFSSKVSPLMTISKNFPIMAHSAVYWAYPSLLNLFFIYHDQKSQTERSIKNTQLIGKRK